MQSTDTTTGAHCFRVMVAMRDGTRLNTFVFLPGSGGPRLARHPATARPMASPASDARGQDRLYQSLAAERRGTVARIYPARLAQYRRAWLCRSLPGQPAAATHRKARTGFYADDAGRRLRCTGLDRRPDLDQSQGGHVRLVGRRHHDICRRLDTASDPCAPFFAPGRRFEHL